MKRNLAGLYDQTAQAFIDVKVKVEKLEADTLKRGGSGKSPSSTTTQAFISIKSMVPAV